MRAGIVGAVVVVSAACTSSSSSSSNVECTHASQCITAQCRCNLGTGELSPPIAACIDEKCETLDQLCTDHCKSNGGVKDAVQVPNLVGSAECNAFCDRWSKDCGGACAIQACNVGYCAAATKQSLECFATRGITSCQDFLVTDPECIPEKFLSSCPPTNDGGTDADAVADGG